MRCWAWLQAAPSNRKMFSVISELKSYTQMMEKARKMSTDRMIAQAEAMQADAVIGVRYATSAIMAQAAEVLVYGTAIRYK